MSRFYQINITHYLDEKGEVAEIPKAVKKLADYLVLIIKTATEHFPAKDFKTGLPCRKKTCQGRILTSIFQKGGDIYWHCPVCEEQGIITDWQGTKWDNIPKRRY
ncbi:hypothetical protein JW835_06295 [bacterium]|nr:hypothetical protein [bacterium]